MAVFRLGAGGAAPRLAATLNLRAGVASVAVRLSRVASRRATTISVDRPRDTEGPAWNTDERDFQSTGGRIYAIILHSHDSAAS